MQTISISNLKTHLSAELKKVQKGIKITVLDHNKPVAEIIPIEDEPLFAREATGSYTYKPLTPLVKTDPLLLLEEERKDEW